MSFCTKCGTKNPDNVKFCASCGNVVGGDNQAASTPAYQGQKDEIRKSEIAALESVYKHFKGKRALYEEGDRIDDKLERLSRGVRSAMLVWGAILLFLGCIFVISVKGLGIFLLVVGGIFFGICLFRKIFNRVQLAKYQSENERVTKEINDYYRTYPNCPVGVDYTHPVATEALLEYMRSGRADTIKEAINVLIADLNQASLEESQAELAARLRNIERKF